LLLPLGGLTLLGAGFSSRRKKVLGLLLMFLVISGLVFLGACGGGSSSGGGGGGGGGGGTPAGKYTVTVTGTSGTLTAQTAAFTLTVQ
jgi:trimeric autotransporter adhesin